MSTNLAPGLEPTAETILRDLHIRVPIGSWRRAKIAAIDSGMSFKDYMSRIMSDAKPIPPSAAEGHQHG